MRWLLAPATEDVPRAQAVGAAVLRVLLGLMWLYNVSWKRPPDFGNDAGSGLYKYTSYAVSHPVFPPYSWVVEHLVLPAFTPFGWMVLALETLLAVLLLTGAWVRLAAVLGLAQAAAIGLSVAYGPNEWPWSYWLMIGAHLVLVVSSAGRVFAVDAVRSGLTRGRTLARSWGVIAVLVGAFSALASLSDPFAAQGPGLVFGDLSVSLGGYNLLGGLALVIAGGLLLVSGAAESPRTAQAAAVIAILAGLSLEAQVGFSDPLLGGTATSAAFFFSVALVAASGARAGSRRSRPDADRVPAG